MCASLEEWMARPPPKRWSFLATQFLSPGNPCPLADLHRTFIAGVIPNFSRAGCAGQVW